MYELDSRTIQRHQRIMVNYGPEGSKTIRRENERDRWLAEAQARSATLITSGILPSPVVSGDRVVILSPSANWGYAEDIMQQELGQDYLVIAGDLAHVDRVGNAAPMRLNAVALPFYPASIDVIYDTRGALLYEAMADKRGRLPGTNTQRIFDHYWQTLKRGGLLVTDDFQTNPEFVNVERPLGTTGEMVDTVLGGQNPLGFDEPFHVGEGVGQLRVYRRLP